MIQSEIPATSALHDEAAAAAKEAKRMIGRH
jgi:hypothetical protein